MVIGPHFFMSAMKACGELTRASLGRYEHMAAVAGFGGAKCVCVTNAFASCDDCGTPVHGTSGMFGSGPGGVMTVGCDPMTVICDKGVSGTGVCVSIAVGGMVGVVTSTRQAGVLKALAVLDVLTCGWAAVFAL